MLVHDLNVMAYREAWVLQERAHEQVRDGAQEQLLILEHPPVITFGRRGEVEGPKHLIASDELLRARGVEVVQSDRGGDVTFHGPGQIVAYPIVRLADHGLSVSGFVHRLEEVVIATLREFGLQGQTDRAAIGVWVRDPDRGWLAKICALGVRIRRGVSMHGIALNVETDLSFFDLIVPCGLPGRSVTSMRKLLGNATPPIEDVKAALSLQMTTAFAAVPG